MLEWLARVAQLLFRKRAEPQWGELTDDLHERVRMLEEREERERVERYNLRNTMQDFAVELALTKHRLSECEKDREQLHARLNEVENKVA